MSAVAATPGPLPAGSPGHEFSLRGLMRKIRDELGTGDTHLLAKEAAARISRKDRDSAYMQALTEVARVVVNSGHPQVHQGSSSAKGVNTGAGQRNSARSSKVSAIRRAWPQLRATYACLDVNKQLGDYGADDLIFVAAHLDTQATQTAAKAAALRELAPQLARHKVNKVRDLPDAVLAAAFLGEAA